MTFRQSALLLLAIACLLIAKAASPSDLGHAFPARPRTFCNPLDLAYRFQVDAPSRREAADPAMVRYRGEYWLFASKSGGYWHSRNLVDWSFVEPQGLPIEIYAPTVVEIDGKLYYTAFSSENIFVTDDPAGGVWRKVADIGNYPDPALFRNDDGRLYMYYGCSNQFPLMVVELDPRNGFREIGPPVPCLYDQSRTHGWELSGEFNRGKVPEESKDTFRPWLEGSWMTKYHGCYYLQYAAPGTELRTYADGVVVGDSPKGPFRYAPYSPFSHKVTGFVAGAGHSSTCADERGQFWHIVTHTISVRHLFERRLGLYATAFESDGQMITNTYLGDYPQIAPGVAADPAHDNSPGWMLVNLRKPAQASSELAGHPASAAFDEDVRTWWSAATGDPGEWLAVDFGKPCRIEAIQVNFAEQDSTALGRLAGDAERYRLEASADGKSWQTLVDRSENHRDPPHDFIQLDRPGLARHLRIINLHTPAEAKFSISGLRAFGSGLGTAPKPVAKVLVARDPTDGRHALLKWTPADGAEFYIVRYGIAPGRLVQNYQVYDGTTLELNSLNAGVPYIFAVDAINDSGVTRGTLRTAID